MTVLVITELFYWLSKLSYCKKTAHENLSVCFDEDEFALSQTVGFSRCFSPTSVQCAHLLGVFTHSNLNFVVDFINKSLVLLVKW